MIEMALAGGGFLSILLVTLAAALERRDTEQHRHARLLRYSLGEDPAASLDDEVTRPEHALARWCEQALQAVGLYQRLRDQLQGTYLSLSTGNLALRVLLSAIVLTLVALLLNRPLWNLVVAFVLGGWLPLAYLGYRRGKQLRLLRSQLPDALTALTRSLQSGYAIIPAIEVVARESQPPIAIEFETTIRQVHLGLSLEDALGNLRARVPDENVALFATVVGVQHRAGGNLILILQSIVATVQERIEIEGQVRSLTGSARLSARLLTALPLGVAAVIYLLSPAYLAPLYTTVLGRIILGLSAVMTVIGYFVMQRIAAVHA